MSNSPRVISSIDNLPEGARKKFESFLNTPGMWGQSITSLHPLDWKKFYLFIHHCTRPRVKISTADVKDLLLQANFKESFATYVSDVFTHGVGLVKSR
jgi:hypothetical protein